MNITVLNKIESGWIKLDWSEWIDRIKLSDNDLETILDIIDNFKGNKRTKEIVICRFKYLSAYVTVGRPDYVKLLDWIYDRLIERELYEKCNTVLNIKTKLYDKV